MNKFIESNLTQSYKQIHASIKKMQSYFVSVKNNEKNDLELIGEVLIRHKLLEPLAESFADSRRGRDKASFFRSPCVYEVRKIIWKSIRSVEDFDNIAKEFFDRRALEEIKNKKRVDSGLTDFLQAIKSLETSLISCLESTYTPPRRNGRGTIPIDDRKSLEVSKGKLPGKDCFVCDKVKNCSMVEPFLEEKTFEGIKDLKKEVSKMIPKSERENPECFGAYDENNIDCSLCDVTRDCELNTPTDYDDEDDEEEEDEEEDDEDDDEIDEADYKKNKIKIMAKKKYKP